MRLHKPFFKSFALTTLLFAGIAAHGIAQDTTTIVNPETQPPIIISTSPAGGELNIETGVAIEIVFSNNMDESSINGSSLLLQANYVDTIEERENTMLDEQILDMTIPKEKQNRWEYSTGTVSGTISYSNKVAIFTPDNGLEEGTLYTFTVTKDVRDTDNVPLENAQNWSFKTSGTSDTTIFQKNQSAHKNGKGGPKNFSMYATPVVKMMNVDLGSAERFVILAKTTVHNQSGSKITGHIGQGSYVDNTKEGRNTLKSGMQNMHSQSNGMRTVISDTTSPNVNDGITDMESALAKLGGSQSETQINHNNESFHRSVLAPGVHKWNGTLQVTSDVTLSGSAEDVWLFKTDNNLTVFENTVITLTNGARAENVFWFVEGKVAIGKHAEFKGIILSMKDITFETGATLNGRMFSQSSIKLDNNTVTEPKKTTRLSTLSEGQ